MIGIIGTGMSIERMDTQLLYNSCFEHLLLVADMLQHITRPHKRDTIMINSRATFV